MLKKVTSFFTIGMRPHDCICVLIWQRLLTKSLHSLTMWYGDKLSIFECNTLVNGSLR